jgi:hypothetical protein
MAQIPALFLPKQTDNGQKAKVKTAPKKRQFKKKEEKQTQRVATLLT